MKNPLDYIDAWYDNRPPWVQLLLFPIPLVLSLAMLPYWIFVAWPCFIIDIIKFKLENRRFWRRLRERSQVAKWSEVAPVVAHKASTMIVEVGPKGPTCAWWIDRPRGEIDPDCVVPSWQDFEEREWEVVFKRKANYDQVEQWSLSRLAAYESSAQAVAPVPSWSQLSQLETDTKRDAVLVMCCWDGGCLSRSFFEKIH